MSTLYFQLITHLQFKNAHSMHRRTVADMNENTKKESWISRNRYVAFVIVIGLIDFIVRGVIRGQLNPSSLVVVAIATLAASYADKKRRFISTPE